MADRIASDHEAVETHRVTLGTAGRTSRPELQLPESIDASDGDVVRITLDGQAYHARVDAGLDDTCHVSGAFDNARLAREDEGENRLVEWIDDSEAEPGRSLLLDVLSEGYHYGLREPGQRVVYTVHEPPQGSLSDIADSLG
ncbi:DUF7112 family protein [Halapricum hydrolyticum]|uniref:Uncharacterized protein n=1 Tax=Halapricum hydrolyticum TaxID=2979991 RepID=A0AAE3LI34_9EURY|nr:hypothetical protein [Halapricum hydrolyticum]MCU4718467.1 hypothetical protein [Halapricum hydrolyticum]MCU4727514.1 hypothetical protein [Halapricum hydrolyticum]